MLLLPFPPTTSRAPNARSANPLPFPPTTSRVQHTEHLLNPLPFPPTPSRTANAPTGLNPLPYPPAAVRVANALSSSSAPARTVHGTEQPRPSYSAHLETPERSGTTQRETLRRQRRVYAPGWVPKPREVLGMDESDLIEVESEIWHNPNIGALSPKLQVSYLRLQTALLPFGHFLPLCQFLDYVELWGSEFAEEVADLPEKTLATLFEWGYEQSQKPDLDYNGRCAYCRWTFALWQIWQETKLENTEHDAQLRRVIAHGVQEGELAPEEYAKYIFGPDVPVVAANGERLVPAGYPGVGKVGLRDWDAMQPRMDEGLPMFDATRQALDAHGDGPSFAERAKQHQPPPEAFQKQYGRDSTMYLFSTGDIRRGGSKWYFAQHRIKNLEGKEWAGEMLEMLMIDAVRGGGRRESLNRSPLSNHRFPPLDEYARQAAGEGRGKTIIILVPKYMDNSANQSCRLHIRTIVEQQQLGFSFLFIWLAANANPQEVIRHVQEHQAAGVWFVGDEVLKIMAPADAVLPAWGDAKAGRVYPCAFGPVVISERLGTILRSFGGGSRDWSAEKAVDCTIGLAAEILDLEIDVRVSSAMVGGRMAPVVHKRTPTFRIRRSTGHVTAAIPHTTAPWTTTATRSLPAPAADLPAPPEPWHIGDLKEGNGRCFAIGREQEKLSLMIDGLVVVLCILRRRSDRCIYVPEGDWIVTLSAVRVGRRCVLKLADVGGKWNTSFGESELLIQSFETVVALHERCVDEFGQLACLLWDLDPESAEGLMKMTSLRPGSWQFSLNQRFQRACQYMGLVDLPGPAASPQFTCHNAVHLVAPGEQHVFGKLVLTREGPDILIDGSAVGCANEYVGWGRKWSWTKGGAAFRLVLEVLKGTHWWREQAEKIGMTWTLKPPTPIYPLPDFRADSTAGYFTLPINKSRRIVINVTTFSEDACAAGYAVEPAKLYTAVVGSSIRIRLDAAWKGRSEIRVKWVRVGRGRFKLRHEGQPERHVAFETGEEFILGAMVGTWNDKENARSERLAQFFEEYFPFPC